LLELFSHVHGFLQRVQYSAELERVKHLGNQDFRKSGNQEMLLLNP
jgi:hypothetical protein